METSLSAPLFRNWPSRTTKSSSNLFKPSVILVPSSIEEEATAEFKIAIFSTSSDAAIRLASLVISITGFSDRLPVMPNKSATCEFALLIIVESMLLCASARAATNEVIALMFAVVGWFISKSLITALILKSLSRFMSSPKGMSPQLGVISQIIFVELGSAVISTNIGPL